jgi:hypothetical protein
VNVRLKRLAFCFLATFCIGIGAVAVAQTPNPKPVVVNQTGPYTDKGVWLYRNAAGTYGYGPAVLGTNELLTMPAPSPSPGGSVAGVMLIRHPFDSIGYPLHIALVEKLFAASYQTTIEASEGGDIWKHEFTDPVAVETPTTGGTRLPFKFWGPFHADAIPFQLAPEPEIQPAFKFAKSALGSIANMPASQKSLANYGVLFVDDGDTVWVEFGPRFGPNEAPHLGCQTQLGRDMVIGYMKKQADAKGTSGKFLQCF